MKTTIENLKIEFNVDEIIMFRNIISKMFTCHELELEQKEQQFIQSLFSALSYRRRYPYDI